MEVIGEKLKASREEKGLSLEEVSEDLKIDIKDLENIEIGNRKYFDDVYSLKNYIYEYAEKLECEFIALIAEKDNVIGQKFYESLGYYKKVGFVKLINKEKW